MVTRNMVTMGISTGDLYWTGAVFVDPDYEL